MKPVDVTKETEKLAFDRRYATKAPPYPFTFPVESIVRVALPKVTFRKESEP
jgi:hypothetical protein